MRLAASKNLKVKNARSPLAVRKRNKGKRCRGEFTPLVTGATRQENQYVGLPASSLL